MPLLAQQQTSTDLHVDASGLAAFLVVIIVVRVALIVVDLRASIDLVRRSAAEFRIAGSSLARWFTYFAIVPFASVYYLIVVRPQLDAAATRISHREVVYDLRAWDAASRDGMTEALRRRHVEFRQESDDLVVAKADEEKADAIVDAWDPT